MFKKELNLVSCKVGVDLNEEPKQEEKKDVMAKKFSTFFKVFFYT